MSAVLPTDKTLVNRAGVDHSASADMSTVQDADLLLINRAGVDYKCTFADWKNSQKKAPDVGAVTLADVAAGDRFTSVAFPVSATMTEDGVPTSTKKLKAYVEGALKAAAQTSAITAVTLVPGPRTYKVQRSGKGNISQALPGFTGPWTMDHAGTVGDNFYASSPTTTQVIEVPSGSPYWTFTTYTSIALADIKDHGYYVSNSLSGPWTLIPLTAAGLVPGVDYPVRGHRFAGFSSPYGGWDGASQVLSLTDSSFTTLTFTDNTQLTNFAGGDAITEVGNGDDATGTVGGIDATANTMTLATTAGTWDIGSVVKGPLRTKVITPKTSAITNVAGNVLTLTDDKDLVNFRVGDVVQGGNHSVGGSGGTYDTTTYGWDQFFNGSLTGGYVQPAANTLITFTATPPIPATTAALTYMAQSEAFSGGGYLAVNGTKFTSLPVNPGGGIAPLTFDITPYLVGGKLNTIECYMSSTANGGLGMFGLTTDGRIVTNSAEVSITAIDKAKPSVTVSGGSWSGTDGTSSGVAAAREAFVTGPPRPSASVKLFCKLDAAGAVSDLQTADPGFTAWTPAGTGPYTGTVTFPATLPTGNAPDTDLPAGTTVTVEVEASNASGTDSAKSNTVTPT